MNSNIKELKELYEDNLQMKLERFMSHTYDLFAMCEEALKLAEQLAFAEKSWGIQNGPAYRFLAKWGGDNGNS